MLTAKGYNGTVVFDGNSVTIRRTGIVARLTIGKGDKTIPIRHVTAVQFKGAGLTNGFLQFTLPGGYEPRSRFGKQTASAASDENTVTFLRGQQADFETIRDAIREAIATD